MAICFDMLIQQDKFQLNLEDYGLYTQFHMIVLASFTNEREKGFILLCRYITIW